jgi:type IV secretory pathway VirB10-like protein
MMGFRSLVTPAGGVVDLAGLRVSDQQGRVGVGGELHTQTLRRMGIAFLFALESVGMDRLTKNQTTVSTSGTTATTSNSSEAAKIISEAAKQEPRLRPVQPYITIDQGQLISIVTTVGMEVPPVANRR